MRKPDLLAVKAVYWFCERFNCQFLTEESLTSVQKAVLRQI